MYDSVINDEKLGRSIYYELKNEFNINENNIDDVLFKTKQLRLIELYKKLNIDISDNMNENALLAQTEIDNKNLNTKDFLGDLYFLHSQYLSKK